MKKILKLFPYYSCISAAILISAVFFSKTVSVMAENEPIVRQNCIIIDAGHGGEDGGATSCSGTLESWYNLQITVRLNDLFHLMGYDTYMVRTTDSSVYTNGDTIAQKKVSDLKERVRIVNDTSNSLLLSIHQNFFQDGKYKGAQVFYSNTVKSKLLASMLQEKLVSTLNPGSTRTCKPAKGIYLMEHITKPGVLIECGFLSNPEEEALLRDSTYQKKLCSVIAVTTADYIENALNTNT